MTATEVHASLPLPVLPKDWQAENNFKAIGTLSQPIMRAVEPVGPAFLSHARRSKHKRTFSEDDRIQAEAKAKKVEDEDSGEISEPEDPLMLQRDAKDWKVCPAPPTAPYIHLYTMADSGLHRAKTITQCLGSLNIATKPRKTKSSVPIAKRFSNTTPTSEQRLAARTMIPFSNAFKKPPRSSSTR